MRKLITTAALAAAAIALSACEESVKYKSLDEVGTATTTVTTTNAGAVTIPTSTVTVPTQVVTQALPAPVISSTSVVTAVPESFIIRGTSFALDSDRLLSSGRNQLSGVAQTMLSQGGTYNVTGYASTEGDENYNLNLSERRARSVAAYLVGQGVPSSSLISNGAGETTQFGSDLASNRRVQITQVGGSSSTFSTGGFEVISSTPIFETPITTTTSQQVVGSSTIIGQPVITQPVVTTGGVQIIQ